MAGNPSDKISQIGRIDPIQSVQSTKNQSFDPSQSFKSLMNTENVQPSLEKGNAASPFDLAAQGKSIGMTPPTQEGVLGQMSSTSSVLGDLQTRMHRKGRPLNQSEKHLLRSKLTNANQSIRGIAKKMGVEEENKENEDPASSLNKNNPFSKFLNLLSDSQTQLAHAQSKIKELNANGISMNPGDLLLIQVKLTKAQQELEFSSILMSTGVSDIKTLFNIQL